MIEDGRFFDCDWDFNSQGSVIEGSHERGGMSGVWGCHVEVAFLVLR